jgi:hypothetical protein
VIFTRYRDGDNGATTAGAVGLVQRRFQKRRRIGHHWRGRRDTTCLPTNARGDIRLRIDRRDQTLHVVLALVACSVEQRFMIVVGQVGSESCDGGQRNIAVREACEDARELPSGSGSSNATVRSGLGEMKHVCAVIKE